MKFKAGDLVIIKRPESLLDKEPILIKGKNKSYSKKNFIAYDCWYVQEVSDSLEFWVFEDEIELISNL
jgi:hypothetical protein